MWPKGAKQSAIYQFVELPHTKPGILSTKQITYENLWCLQAKYWVACAQGQAEGQINISNEYCTEKEIIIEISIIPTMLPPTGISECNCIIMPPKHFLIFQQHWRN